MSRDASSGCERSRAVPGWFGLACLMAAGPAVAGVGVFRPAGEDLPGVRAFDVDPAGLAELRSTRFAAVEGLELPGVGPVTLQMRPASVLAPGARVVVASARGERPLDLADLAMFSGRVEGFDGSAAFLSFLGGGVNGVIVLGDLTFVVSTGPGGRERPVVFNPAAIPDGTIRWEGRPCGAGAAAERLPLAMRIQERSAPVSAPSFGPRGAPCRIADIAVETDAEYRAIFGNADVAGAYALTLWGAVSEIYQRDLNTRLRVSFLRVWADDADPYSTTDTLDRLFEFQDYWNANMEGVPRDVSHILSGVRGRYGGVAYLPGLCNRPYGYGLSTYLNGFFPYPLRDNNPQNWDLMVVGHELGHNFGAPHTHEMSPPVDGCGSGDCSAASAGTIMSYCHICSGGVGNIALTLHPRVIGERILPFLDSLSCHLGPGGECAGDYDGDGFVDFFDFDSFVECFDGGACPPCQTPDFNGDGFADVFDYDDFVSVFEGGC